MYEKLVVYAMIKKGEIYALRRNNFSFSLGDAHAWWNYKENLCLINFSLPLIYDFSLCFRLLRHAQLRGGEESFQMTIFRLSLGSLFRSLHKEHSIKRFSTRKTSDFDPQKYVTNFIPANRFTINPSLMLPIKPLAVTFNYSASSRNY